MAEKIVEKVVEKVVVIPRNPFETKEETIEPTEADGFLWLPGWAVTVQEIPYAMQQDLILAGVSVNTSIPTSRAEVEAKRITPADIDNRKGTLARMKAGIKSWTFENEQGQIVPVSDLALEKLDGQSGAFIMEAIDRLNPTIEDEDDFPGDARNHNENGKG